VYVCPRRQLVRQVLQEAQALGVPAVEYPPDQSHPAPEGLRGEAILVCTYDKMFNGKTTFRRDDVRLVPHAVVLDDAHAGIEEVRDNFTLRLPVGSAIHAAVLDALLPARKYLERGGSTLTGKTLARFSRCRSGFGPNSMARSPRQSHNTPMPRHMCSSGRTCEKGCAGVDAS
jgi:hypothetical protein